ncbi:protein-tyrosine-phosphatase [Bacteroidota bacterium]
MSETVFNAGLRKYFAEIESEFSNISSRRKKTLKLLGEYIKVRLKEQSEAELLFICTHNSRRSQFGQVWAETAARYCGIDRIRSFSGGIEATAFYPEALAAILRAGFSLDSHTGNEANPQYLIRSGAGIPAITMFSKKHDNAINPSENFCAIMVCSDADEACPHIPGAEKRIAILYDDPKVYDGSDMESQKYDERCREIARDLFYVFKYVNNEVIQITFS